MLPWPGVLVAVAVSAGLSGLLAWSGPVDRPRERGMHRAPTPTSGGLAILGGTAAALLVFALLGGNLPDRWPRFPDGALLPDLSLREAGVVLAFASLIAAIGGLDDVFDMPARTKLLVQVGLAALFALFTPSNFTIPVTDTFGLDLRMWIGWPGITLWIVVVLNAVNFMDGSNGLVAGSMAIVLGGLGLQTLGAGSASFGWLLLAAAAAAVGFLPFNFPKARLFQGDAGALFLGAIAASAWVYVGEQAWPSPRLNLLAMPIALAPFLTDVFLTLILRARRRERLFDAHRDHLYQRWLATHGGDHAALARRVWTIMAVYTLLGAIVARGSAHWASLALVGGVIIAVCGWLWIDRSVRRRLRSGDSDPAFPPGAAF